MHELSIAEEIYRSSRSAVADRGAGRLDAVRVAVGELAAIEPDLLRFAWQAVTAGSSDDGCALDVDWRPARQVCAACGEVGQRAPGSWLRLCPSCQGVLRIEGGGELDLIEVTFTATGGATEGVNV